MGKAIRYTLAFGIAAFFAVMWALMVRAHMPAGGRAAVRPNYGALLRPDEDRRVENWGVYFGEVRIGSSQVTTERLGDGTISVLSEAQARLPATTRLLFGVTGTLDLEFQATVSPLRGPLSFRVKSDLLNVSLEGVVQPGKILLGGNLGGRRISTTVPYDPDKLLGEALSPLATVPELKESAVGTTWTMSLVNPVSGQVQEVTGTVADARRVKYGGREVTAFELRLQYGTSQWTSWATQDGQVLIQGTPFGLTLRREDVDPETLAALEAPAREGLSGASRP
jgi:hypothetical protein